MATTVLKDSYIAMSDYNGGGYHKAYYRCGGVYYDDVTRSGNTVTIHNVKIKSYVQFVRTNGSYFGYTAVYYDWIGIWDSSSTTASGTAPVAKTTQFKNNDSNTRYYDTPHTVRTGDLNIGNVSFTVSGDSAGTKTFKLGLAFGKQNSNSNSNSYRASSDPAPTFTVSYPANTVSFVVKGSKDGTAQDTTSGMGSFDVTLGGTKVGEDVNTYNGSAIYNSSYTVSDIRETSNNYYYTGSTSYTGTATSATTITLPFTSTVAPNDVTPTIVSRSYNSIVAKTTASNYGAPINRTGRYVEIGLAPATGTSYSDVVLKQSASDTTSTANKTFDQSNDSSLLTIAGARSFKICGYASNTKKSATNLPATVYWLPPAPLASVTLKDTAQGESNAVVTMEITGGLSDDVHNISGARVNTQYRISTDGGTSYSAWVTISSNISPESVVETSINVPYNTAVIFQASQVTTGDTTQRSEIKTYTIAPIPATPPNPVINFVYDDLNRKMTITVTGGAGFGTAFASRDIQLRYSGDVSFANVNLTTDPTVYTISYLKPQAHLLISARTNNTDGGSSEWTTVETTVRRPIWGVVTEKDDNDNDVQYLIRDMVKVTNNGVSKRDWVEGQFLGKKRIVKN